MAIIKAPNSRFQHVRTGKVITAHKMGEKMYLDMFMRLIQEGENIEDFTLPDKETLIEQGLSWLENNEDYVRV